MRKFLAQCSGKYRSQLLPRTRPDVSDFWNGNSMLLACAVFQTALRAVQLISFGLFGSTIVSYISLFIILQGVIVTL